MLPGDELRWRITVVNEGNAAATRVTVTDVLPKGLTLVQGSWAREDGPPGEIEAMLTPQEAQQLRVSVGTLLTLQGDFFTRRADMLGGTTPDPAARMKSFEILGGILPVRA